MIIMHTKKRTSYRPIKIIGVPLLINIAHIVGFHFAEMSVTTNWQLSKSTLISFTSPKLSPSSSLNHQAVLHARNESVNLPHQRHFGAADQ